MTIYITITIYVFKEKRVTSKPAIRHITKTTMTRTFSLRGGAATTTASTSTRVRETDALRAEIAHGCERVAHRDGIGTRLPGEGRLSQPGFKSSSRLPGDTYAKATSSVRETSPSGRWRTSAPPERERSSGEAVVLSKTWNVKKGVWVSGSGDGIRQAGTRHRHPTQTPFNWAEPARKISSDTRDILFLDFAVAHRETGAGRERRVSCGSGRGAGRGSTRSSLEGTEIEERIDEYYGERTRSCKPRRHLDGAYSSAG